MSSTVRFLHHPTSQPCLAGRLIPMTRKTSLAKGTELTPGTPT